MAVLPALLAAAWMLVASAPLLTAVARLDTTLDASSALVVAFAAMPESSPGGISSSKDRSALSVRRRRNHVTSSLSRRPVSSHATSPTWRGSTPLSVAATPSLKTASSSGPKLAHAMPLTETATATLRFCASSLHGS